MREKYKPENFFFRSFSRWRTLDKFIYDDKKRLRLLCECSCETKSQKYVLLSTLLNGGSQSCGCLNKEVVSKTMKKYNTYDLTGEYGISYTTNTNEQFFFDLEDYDKIKNYNWHISIYGYIRAYINGKMQFLHKFITEMPSTQKVDHINQSKLDNRKNNLRLCNTQQNGFNSKIQKNNTSGFTGVVWDKRLKMWKAQIFYNGHSISLGSFHEKQDAINCRINAEQKYFGEFAPKREEVSICESSH